MDINSHITPVLIIVFGLLAFFVAFKVANFVLKAELNKLKLPLFRVSPAHYICLIISAIPVPI